MFPVRVSFGVDVHDRSHVQHGKTAHGISKNSSALENKLGEYACVIDYISHEVQTPHLWNRIRDWAVARADLSHEKGFASFNFYAGVVTFVKSAQRINFTR